MVHTALAQPILGEGVAAYEDMMSSLSAASFAGRAAKEIPARDVSEYNKLAARGKNPVLSGLLSADDAAAALTKAIDKPLSSTAKKYELALRTLRNFGAVVVHENALRNVTTHEGTIIGYTYDSQKDDFSFIIQDQYKNQLSQFSLQPKTMDNYSLRFSDVELTSTAYAVEVYDTYDYAICLLSVSSRASRQMTWPGLGNINTKKPVS